MKSFLQRFVPILLFVVLCSFAVHKFYVAIYQVNYEPKKKELQITTRIFIDDLEKALETRFHKKIYLATSKEIPQTDDLIKSYLSEKFRISVNSSSKSLKFLGKETEDNVLICYLTTPVLEKINTISIHNSVLTETYDEQQNIVHFKVNGNKKTVLMTDSEPDGQVEF
ncbi:DUF6702 family protein [Flavobacterium sp.]|uniref:DUF6702 family protein n=1 Tax=Flavobacterium sp. TaxID=239 RepID=UPI0028BD1DE6|nr:DUF6702 family protein [Flavobacterium sp.]